MFLILIHYTQSLDAIDRVLADHRAFLEAGYQKNFFVVSGPREPRTGGVVLSQLTDRAQLEAILKNDPFAVHGLAEYEIIEFHPVKHHPDFSAFITS